MATPTTLAAAKAQYLANADYADAGGDVEKAREFRTACRALEILQPESASNGAHAANANVKALAAALSQVQTWLAEHDTAQASTRGGAIAMIRRGAR